MEKRINKSEILYWANRRAEELTAMRPSFGLFRRAYEGFAVTLNALPCREITCPDSFVQNELHRLFCSVPGEDAGWAHLFLLIDSCTNFDASFWRALVTADHRNAAYAVEHCYYVNYMSSANGSNELADLLDQTDAWDVASSKLQEIGIWGIWDNWSRMRLPPELRALLPK